MAIDENDVSALTVWRGAVMAVDENTINQPNPTQLKVWDGVQWVRKPYYVWNGSAWVQIT